jgi:hypothetical protein
MLSVASTSRRPWYPGLPSGAIHFTANSDACAELERGGGGAGVGVGDDDALPAWSYGGSGDAAS